MTDQKPDKNLQSNELRDQYQTRLDAGERIAGLAREAGVSESTMRWRLKKLGVSLQKKAETDPRYLDGGRAKYLVSDFMGSSDIEETLYNIGQSAGIDVSRFPGTAGKLEALLLHLTPTNSNLQIAEIFKVNEKSVRKWCKKFGIETKKRGEWAKIRPKGR